METAITVLQRELAHWQEQLVHEVEYWKGDENCDRAKEAVAECHANIKSLFDAIEILEKVTAKKEFDWSAIIIPSASTFELSNVEFGEDGKCISITKKYTFNE